jgi:hypothetical protein
MYEQTRAVKEIQIGQLGGISEQGILGRNYLLLSFRGFSVGIADERDL